MADIEKICNELKRLIEQLQDKVKLIIIKED